MNHKIILEKLIEIQHAIGTQNNLTVQKMLMEAEDCLLQLEREIVEQLIRSASLPPPSRIGLVERRDDSSLGPETIAESSPQIRRVIVRAEKRQTADFT
jgi:hypothetical protein